MKDGSDSRYSIIVLAKTEKAFSFSIASWLPKFLLASMLISFTLILFSFGRRLTINSKLEENNSAQDEQIFELEASIEELHISNREKDLTVDKLRKRNQDLDNKAGEIQKKLRDIAKLKEELENLSKNK